MSTMKSRRLVLNPKALFLSSLVLVTVLIGGVWLKVTQANRLRKAAVAQAERDLGAGHADKALRSLDHFLGSSPDDIPSLELKARILTDAARDAGQLREAAQWNDRLLRLDPNGPGRQDTRRRLAELYIRYSDGARNSTLADNAPEMAASEVRYRSAEVLAQEMIRIDPADGSGYRLLGMALEGKTTASDIEGSQEVAAAYESALRINPRDAVASEHLVNLYRDRLKDAAKAKTVLKTMLLADPQSVEVRLARARYYDRIQDKVRTADELAEAVKLAPTNAAVRLAAAEYASRTGNMKLARANLDAIPAESREGLRARVIRGMIDLSERQPEAAIEGWRAGLAGVEGADADMSWWLAFVLLQSDRVGEASPLITQYIRLIGDENEPRAVLLQALLSEKSGRPLEAIARLNKFAEKANDSLRPMFLQAIGRCSEAVADMDGAMKAYRETATLSPSDPGPKLAIARLLEARRPGEAIDYLRSECRASTVDPSLQAALAGALIRGQARSPVASRTWTETDAVLAALTAAAPNFPGLILMQADRQILAGDAAGGTARLEAATQSTPHDASTWVSYATLLDRQGKSEAALTALKAAAAPTAAGDRSTIRIAQARILAGLGRGREAKDLLVRNLDGLTSSDRVSIQEALGRFLATQGDTSGARAAYEAWAAMVPHSLQPRLALVDLALASDDDAQLGTAVKSLQSLSGSQDMVGRLARVIEILRELDKTKDPALRAAAPGTKEAAKILEDLRRMAPEYPSVALLNGQVLDILGQVDAAASEYRRAWDRGLDIALVRLVAMLAKHHRVDDLASLRRDRPPNVRLERLLASAAKQLGDAKSVETLIGAAAKTTLPEALVARADVLASTGKIAEAEALLKKRAEESKGQEVPWTDLLRFQVKYGRSQTFASTIQSIKTRVTSRKPEIVEANCLSIVGDRAGSERVIASALKSYPDDIEVLIAAANVSRSSGKNAEALAHLRHALQLDPKRVDLARQLSTTLAQDARNAAEWQKAWESLEPESSDPETRLVRNYVLIHCPDPERRKTAIAPLEELLNDLSVDHPIARGARDYLIRLLVDEKQIDRAVKLAAIGADREFDANATTMYINMLIIKRDFAQAHKQLDRLRSLAPSDRREVRLRVILIREESAAGQAATSLEKAFLDRVDDPSVIAFGTEAFLTLFAMGQTAASAATRIAEVMASKDPAQSWALARLAAREGRRDDAFRLARLAISKGSQLEIAEATQVMVGIATVPAQTRATIDAVASVVDEAVAREPRSAAIILMAGVLRHLQERYNDEADLYRTVLNIQPSNPIARNNLAWVIGEDQGKPDEGLSMIDKLIHDEGANAARLSTRGVILMRLGRLGEAIRDIEESIKLQPSALSSYYLALTYHKLGRDADSARTLASARKAGLSPSDIDVPLRAEYKSLLVTSKSGQ